MSQVSGIGLRPTVNAGTSQAGVATATQAQTPTKPAPAKPGRGSNADVTSPANVYKDQVSQDPVSQLKVKIARYQNQLTEKLRKTYPKKWAELQRDLGIAYTDLGNRTGKKEELKKAVMAFDKALNVFKSNNASRAEIQYKRGNALMLLGGTEELRKAVAGFNEALKVSESDKTNRAEIQLNIGIALECLARNIRMHAEEKKDIKELKGAIDLLRESAKAFNAAINSGTKARTDAINAKDDDKIEELNRRLQDFQEGLNYVQTSIKQAEAREKELEEHK
jgi:tetratricopeptide (TPR) repeat protein